MAVGLVVDQEQVKEGLLGGTAVGQVFTPTQPRLERVDVILKNRTDHTPGRIRLLKWAGNYAETIKQPAVWEDDADFSGADHLLIWFAPKAGASVDWADMSRRVQPGKPWYSSAPWCVYQCAGPLAVSAEEPAWFTSLLLPLAADQAAGEAAEQVRVVSDSRGATVLEVRQGAVKWTLAVINDGQAHVVGPFMVEAKAALVREAPGQEPAVAAFGAKSVKAGGEVLMESEERKTWELGWWGGFLLRTGTGYNGTG